MQSDLLRTMEYRVVLLLMLAALATSHGQVCKKSKKDCFTGDFCLKCKEGTAPWTCTRFKDKGESCGKQLISPECGIATVRCAPGLKCRKNKQTCKCRRNSEHPSCVSKSTPAPSTTSAAPSVTCTQYGTVAVGNACKQYGWKFGPNLPVAHGEGTVAIIDEQLYLIGDGQLGLSTKDWTFRLDLGTMSWEDPGDGYVRAQRQFPGDHAAGEVYKGKWYTFAGLCCQTYCHKACGASQKVQIYDPANDQWSMGSNVPWPVDGSLSSTIIGDKIYVCGGLNHDWNQHFSECGIYSPETDSWSSMASLPKGVHHTAAGTDGSKFYVFGGRENGNYLSDGMPYVQVYTPETNSWELDYSLPTPRTGLGKAAFLGGEFYVIGGETFVDALPTVEIYNPKTKTWRQGPPLPQELHGVYPIVWDNKLLIPGGCPNTDRGVSKHFLIYEEM